MWGLLTLISGQPGSFDPNFRFFRVKALKGFKISGFLGQGLDNLTIFGSGRVEPTFENFGSTRVKFKMILKSSGQLNQLFQLQSPHTSSSESKLELRKNRNFYSLPTHSEVPTILPNDKIDNP